MLLRKIRRFWFDEKGAVLGEYTIILGVVTTAALASMRYLAPHIINAYKSIGNTLN